MLEIRGAGVTFATAKRVAVAVRDVDLDVPDRSVLALLGPSGCGKSTLLRAIAGLEPLTTGRISWDGTDLAGISVHRRGFGLMFQDGVLFPHRDVAGNIAYGLRRIGLPHGEIDARVGDLLELVGLPGYGSRRVATLSGGEAQRVALARALAPRPRLLLLDEPLAALDRSLRERLLADLGSVLRSTGTTAVFVTHDQSEAFAIADLVAVMASGSIRQIGPAAQIWDRPADAWVAGFVGYSSVLDAQAAALIGSTAALGSGSLALRPAALRLHADGPLTGRVTLVAPTPDGLVLTVRIDGVGEVKALAAADLPVVADDLVRLRFDPAGAAVLPGRDTRIGEPLGG
jgi:thiamine transport system ATP-binding protein